jgi:DNA helicase-2/ATP-dependent DNA helicase PcrA
MVESQLSEILSMPSASIPAPAGHGKTEMICDLVRLSTGKQLILTHTHAGVDAIRTRLKKHGISSSTYRVRTIAGFCLYWCNAYPNTARFDTSLSPATNDKFFEQVYHGSSLILQTSWAQRVLRQTYERVIVDEYQDCNITQHRLMEIISTFLPVIVLGDPLQAIFGWAGELVDWPSLAFPRVDIKTYPWRWSKTNPALGEWLTRVRRQLLPVLDGQPVTVEVTNIPNVVTVVADSNFNPYKILKHDGSITFITRYKQEQEKFSLFMGGLFQNDEAQNCTLLNKYSTSFDTKQGIELCLAVIDFVSKCATSVKKELKSYLDHLKLGDVRFDRIQKHQDIGRCISMLSKTNNITDAISLIEQFRKNSVFKVYRKEVIDEMIRALKYSCERMSIYDAVQHIRNDFALQKRYSHFQRLSSRTVLSKGLEFDYVIVDMRKGFYAKDFYVAITRAMKHVYIISDNPCFYFSK